MTEAELDLTVRELLQLAGRQIVRRSSTWPIYDARIDLYHDLSVEGNALQREAGVRVPITMRIKLTAASNWIDTLTPQTEETAIEDEQQARSE